MLEAPFFVSTPRYCFALLQKQKELTSKKILTLEKKLVDGGSEEEGAAMAVCELELGRKQYMKAEGARLARADAGAQSASEKADRLEEICAEQMAAWEEHLATIRSQKATREASWLARRLLLESRDLETVELADEKIAQARSLAGVDTAPQGNEDSKVSEMAKELHKVKSEAAEAAVTAAQAAQAEKDSLLQRLEALEKKLAAVPPAATASTDTSAATLTPWAMEQCNRTIMYTAKDLPELKAQPEKSYKKRLVLIATNLTHWGRAGKVPITFNQLLWGSNGNKEELEEAFAIIQEIAGEIIWERLYAGADVPTDNLVPFQLGCILQESLPKAEEAMKGYAKLVDYGQQASKQFLKLHDEDAEEKKSRSGKCSPY